MTSTRRQPAVRIRDYWGKWFRVPEVLLLLLAISGSWLWISYRSRHLELGMLHRPLRVGIASWPGYAGGIIANNGARPTKDSVFWRGAGDSTGPGQQLLVQFAVVDDPDAGFRALQKGGSDPDGLDLMWSTIDAWAQRLPQLPYKAKAIMQVDWSHGGDAIIAPKNIQRIEDLPGKRIVLPAYGPSRWLLESALRHSGLRDDEQAIRSIRESIVTTRTPREALDRLRNEDRSANAPDVAVLWQPFVSQSEDGGLHVLFSSAEASSSIADVLVATDDFIKREAKSLDVFVRRWLALGVPNAKPNKYRVARLLIAGMPEFGEDAAQVESQLGSVLWTGVQDNIEMFTGQRPAFDRLFERASSLWLQLGLIERAASASEARDSRFIEPLVREWEKARVPPPCDQYVSGPRLPAEDIWNGTAVAKGANLTEVERRVREILDEHADSWFCLLGGVEVTGDLSRDTSVSRNRAEDLRDRLRQTLNMERIQVEGYAFGTQRLPLAQPPCPSGSCPTVLRILGVRTNFGN